MKNRIEFLRRTREIYMSQKELADRLGITRGQLSKIERGSNTSCEVVLKLCEVFNCDARYIFFVDGGNQEVFK